MKKYWKSQGILSVQKIGNLASFFLTNSNILFEHRSIFTKYQETQMLYHGFGN